jgi:hypothetical protein
MLSAAPRDAVTIAAGHHLEPWILAINRIDSGSAAH